MAGRLIGALPADEPACIVIDPARLTPGSSACDDPMLHVRSVVHCTALRPWMARPAAAGVACAGTAFLPTEPPLAPGAAT